jgi:site-specific DNA recombinase
LLDAKVTIEQHNLRIELDRARLAGALRIGGQDNLLSEPIFIDNPVALKRRGIELRLVYTAPDAQSASKDQNLIDLVRRRWNAWQQLVTGPRSDNPVERSHIVRLARLRILAPDITATILEGRQPVELTARSLLRCSELPIGWDDQRRALGFC